MNLMRILVIGGISRSLVNFRGKMLEAMVAAGHEVIGCAGEVEPDAVAQLEAMGVGFRGVALDRRGTSIRGDQRYRRALASVIREVRPDVVLAYTIKPIVYGCLEARRAGVPRVAAMITGAGAAQPGTNLKEKAVSWLAHRLYRRAHKGVDVVFFQNPDDEAMFRDARLLGDAHVVRIPGSGVDLSHYTTSLAPTEPVTFLMIARLLANKGLREYVVAAEAVQKQWPDVRCLLVGPEETGGGGVSIEEIRGFERAGVIEYLGSLVDVRPAFERASVYVLPSYREGTPRTVLEAMAMGRPVITTDAPGCRETVEDGVNGFLVPVRDADALAKAMGRFVEEPGLIEQMGIASRERAEAIYDVHKVNAIILEALGLDA